jgi:hypothetical protein
VGGRVPAAVVPGTAVLLVSGDVAGSGLVQNLVARFGTSTLCAPFLDRERCDRAVTVNSAAGLPDALYAAVTVTAESPGTASMSVLVRPTASPDTVCITRDVAIAVQRIEVRRDDRVTLLRVEPAGGFDVSTCAFDLDPVLVADVLDDPSDYTIDLYSEGDDRLPDAHRVGALRAVDAVLHARLDGEGQGFAPGRARGRRPPDEGLHRHLRVEARRGRAPLDLPPTDQFSDEPDGAACTDEVDDALTTSLVDAPREWTLELQAGDTRLAGRVAPGELPAD